MTIEDVRALLRQRMDEGGGTVAWARRHTVSDVYCRDCVAGRRDPGPTILSALGLTKRTAVSYEADANAVVPEEASGE